MNQFARLFILMLFVFGALLKSKAQDYPFDVKISGTGKNAIIFIPGFASSGSVWNETRKNYEPNFTCYTLTMAGFAGSSPKPNPSFKSWESAIADFISKQKIEKPIIIGHSMGGAWAMALAADYPQLVSKIVVVDALPCLAAFMNPAFQSKENIDCKEMISRITTLSTEQFREMQKQSARQLVADTTKYQQIIDWSMQSDRITFAQMFCDFSNTDLREKIRNIKCPSLILLSGNFSNYKPYVTEQYKNMQTAEIQYATKGLHFIMYDDKEWYDSQLQKFIK